ncbi:MAG: tetratricopeptide repeat protein [Bacteroidales bacterium]|nr:tetratricopeptide repeat protein [Bacteroidales bacterium]
MTHFLTSILLVFLYATLPYQQKVDSLTELLSRASNEQRVDLLNSLSQVSNDDSPDKGVIYGMEALRLSEQLNYPLGKANALNYIAENQFSLGEFEKSVEYQLQALDVFEESDNKHGIVRSLNNLGLCFREIGNIDKAIEFHNKALQLSEEIGDRAGKAKALVSLGICNFAANSIDVTLSFFNKALDISIELENDELISTIYNNMGICYATMGEHKKALNIFSLSLELNTKAENKGASAAILNNIARLYIYLGDFDKAFTAISKSYELGKELKAKAQLVNNYLIFYEYYEAKGNYKRALEYYIKYSDLKDEIIKVQSSERMQNLQALNELEKRDQDLQLLQKDFEVAQGRTRLYTVLFGASFLLLVFGVYIFVMRSRTANQSIELLEKEQQLAEMKLENQQKDYERLELLKIKQQHDYEDEIASKNRDLASLTMQMVQKNELLTKLNEQTQTLTYSANNKETVKEVSRLIEQSLNLDKDWEDFTLHFDSVHPRFFERLLNQFPTLTQKELKQCAYIRINISIKEIANLLNITPKGVEKARSRIKAKLSLTKDEDLVSFILSY